MCCKLNVYYVNCVVWCSCCILQLLCISLYIVLQCLLSILSLPLYIFDCKIKMQLSNSVTLSAVRSLDWQGHN